MEPDSIRYDSNGEVLPPEPRYPRVPHYYGDVVRILFVVGAVFMLVTLPVVRDLLSAPLGLSLFGIVLFCLAAGLTKPRNRWSTIANVLIAAAALLVFEYHAVDGYGRYGFENHLFLINQLLAVNFLIAFYYAVKTARGIFIK